MGHTLFPPEVADDCSGGPFPQMLLDMLIEHIYLQVIEHSGFNRDEHYCSLLHPCNKALSILLPFLRVRLVSRAWRQSVMRLGLTHSFFRRVEDAYYPHLWHINTRVRMGVLLRHFRVYQTITTESGDRGVYRAYDFSGPKGCSRPSEVIIKAWTSPHDRECLTEARTYRSLNSTDFPPLQGIPVVLASGYNTEYNVYTIVMSLLGPTLQDLLERTKGGRLSDKVVAAAAIQMLDRYRDIHTRGVVHNGMKPANICLPSANYKGSPAGKLLHAIDFGLSFELDHADGEYGPPLPQRVESVGSRRFMSIMGHLGMSHSQRDDLESLAYLLSLLHHGSLPWDAPYIPSPPVRAAFPDPQPQSVPHLWRRKMAVPASVLFAGMDDAYTALWNEVKGLAYGEVPDYARMRERFAQMWRGKGWAGEAGEVDWWDVWDGACYREAEVQQLASTARDESTVGVTPLELEAPLSIPIPALGLSKPLPAAVDESTMAFPEGGTLSSPFDVSAVVSVAC